MGIGKNVKRIHFVGIKGIAMAALAAHCHERGYYITGSDTNEIYPSEAVLSQLKLKFLQGFLVKNIESANPDLVIYTGAHDGINNIEVQEAIRRGIPTLAHGKALGSFMEGKRQVSIAGCHGKTTTTSMVVTILSEVKRDPSYVIGSGVIEGLGLPGHYGTGDIFISEADEYVTDPQSDVTPRFLWQTPEILVITNVDYDHPDFYPSLSEVKTAYQLFRSKINKNGTLIINNDDGNSQYLKKGSNIVVTVGRKKNADYVITNESAVGQGSTFLITHTNIRESLTIKVPGKHNIQNAAMAAVAAEKLGVPWDGIRKGLMKFGGVKRRFEYLGSINNVLYYDDYAHHPNEINATLRAARELYPNSRIIVVFQPHTYSRTKALLTDFAKCFMDADICILTNIYASAREIDKLGITGKTLVRETLKKQKNVLYAENRKSVENILKKIVHPHDVVFFMGAGDIYSWEQGILRSISTNI